MRVSKRAGDFLIGLQKTTVVPWEKHFFAWYELPGIAPMDRPCVYYATVYKTRLDGACKAQLRH